MDFAAFEARAHEMWAEIPDDYKEGIDGISVRREAEAHEDHPDYYTLGMCFTEPYPSGYMGPETTRSILALYWGSFRKIAARSEGFDWEEELWETITHELRHHLEFLADDDALEGLDYAMEETYKRGDGEPFDPWYWQQGIPLAPGVTRVEYDVYIERRMTDADFARAVATGRIEFEWNGARWAIPCPEELGDLHWIWIEEMTPMPAGGRDRDAAPESTPPARGPDTLQLVLVRERPFLDRVKRFFGPNDERDLVLLESDADAERIGNAPGSPGPMDGRPGRAAGGPPRNGPAPGESMAEDEP